MKPTKLFVPFEEARHWRTSGDWLYQVKKDGRFWPAEFGEFGMDTERMKDGTLWAHTLTRVAGQDLTRAPLRETMPELRRIVASLSKTNSNLRLMPEFNGGEGLEALLQAGEEGGVAKCYDCDARTMWACKRSQVFYCRVIGLIPSTGSVILADRDSGEMRGRLPLRGNKFDQVRGGSVLKVVGFGLTAKGLIREARPDFDSRTSWLARF